MYPGRQGVPAALSDARAADRRPGSFASARTASSGTGTAKGTSNGHASSSERPRRLSCQNASGLSAFVPSVPTADAPSARPALLVQTLFRSSTFRVGRRRSLLPHDSFRLVYRLPFHSSSNPLRVGRSTPALLV